MGRNRKRKDRFFWGQQTPAQMRTQLKSIVDTMTLSQEVDVKKPNDLNRPSKPKSGLIR